VCLWDRWFGDKGSSQLQGNHTSLNQPQSPCRDQLQTTTIWAKSQERVEPAQESNPASDNGIQSRLRLLPSDNIPLLLRLLTLI